MNTEKLRTALLKALEPIFDRVPEHKKILLKAINQEEITEEEERAAYDAIIYLEKEANERKRQQYPTPSGPGGRD